MAENFYQYWGGVTTMSLDWQPTLPPTDLEWAEQEHHRAEQLATRLRELGKEPDRI